MKVMEIGTVQTGLHLKVRCDSSELHLQLAVHRTDCPIRTKVQFSYIRKPFLSESQVFNPTLTQRIAEDPASTLSWFQVLSAVHYPFDI